MVWPSSESASPARSRRRELPFGARTKFVAPSPHHSIRHRSCRTLGADCRFCRSAGSRRVEPSTSSRPVPVAVCCLAPWRTASTERFASAGSVAAFPGCFGSIGRARVSRALHHGIQHMDGRHPLNRFYICRGGPVEKAEPEARASASSCASVTGLVGSAE